MISVRGSEYVRALIGEYEELARYYRVMARAKRASIEVYVRTEEDKLALLKDIEWHDFNAADYQEKADQLKGDTNGTEEDLRSSGVPSELPRKPQQFERLECTTVL